jgi:hypothetical protein
MRRDREVRLAVIASVAKQSTLSDCLGAPWIASLALAMTVLATPPVVIARLDRATQYSRGSSNGIEKPRRTGLPGQAGQ